MDLDAGQRPPEKSCSRVTVLPAPRAALESPGGSELIPCWLAPGPQKVERVVPVLPLSREHAPLQRPERSLAICRVVFGQPRQAEMVELAAGGDGDAGGLDRWMVRLEPE